MATKKKPIIQGGVDNYLGNQPQVQAPRKWQSGPSNPPTELAYITEAEKDLILKTDLHGSLKKGPNIGPSGIMSLDSWGDIGGGKSGAEVSAAETGGEGHGMSASEAAGFRAGAVGAGARGTKAEMKEARDIYGRSYRGRDRKTGLGGLLGGIGRGLLGVFGGIPGKLMSGIMGARNLVKRTGTKIGEFGEGIDEFSQYPTLDRYLNRNTDKYKDKPYRGQGQGYDFSDTGQGNNLGLFTNTLGQPIGPGKRVGQDHGLYGMGSSYDQTRMPSNLGTNTQFVEEEELYPTSGLGAAEGGRIGYERGRVVNPGGYQGEKKAENITLPSGLFSMIGWDEIEDQGKHYELDQQFEDLGINTPEQIEEFFKRYGAELKEKGGKYDWGSPTIKGERMMEDEFIPDTRSWFQKLFAQGGRAGYCEGGIARLL